MKSEHQEIYRSIENLCNVHLGVGDKFILKKIMQDFKEGGRPEFVCGGSGDIIRELSCFFPASKRLDDVLRKIDRGEKFTAYVYKELWRKHYRK